ncbi:MAG: GIY-YIG nuclease family protein [Clostridia bacterium]|nr:GIY-YIG nuclease family protein [Clostridia bacterium]
MVFGKKIQLFLVDGSPNGRWICELSNWTGIAYKIPRNLVKKSEDRSELASPGVYFLFGYNDAEDKPLVYIGEAESIIARMKQHLEKKDNWNEVIAFISKDNNLNKAHIKYLEHRFYQIAKECGRYSIDNNNTPTKSSISEADQAEIEEFIYNARILVNALGHRVFENFTDNQPGMQNVTPVFSLNAGNGKAYGKPTNEGFLLLKGSSIHIESAESLNIGIKNKVEESRLNGEIQDNVLMNDRLFSSSSAAAAFAVGYSISGPREWKTEKGETLKKYESKDS